MEKHSLLFEDKRLKKISPSIYKAYVADDMKLQKCRPKITQNALDKFCLV